MRRSRPTDPGAAAVVPLRSPTTAVEQLAPPLLLLPGPMYPDVMASPLEPGAFYAIARAPVGTPGLEAAASAQMEEMFAAQEEAAAVASAEDAAVAANLPSGGSGGATPPMLPRMCVTSRIIALDDAFSSLDPDYYVAWVEAYGGAPVLTDPKGGFFLPPSAADNHAAQTRYSAQFPDTLWQHVLLRFERLGGLSELAAPGVPRLAHGAQCLSEAL